MSGTKAPASLGMMAKFWIPGQVKTRLAAGCTPKIAADIQRELTLYLADSLAKAASKRCVFTAPDECCAEMRLAVSSTWEIVPQGVGDLGARMQRAFKNLLARSQGPEQTAILIGTDLPLTSAEIELAVERLQGVDVVLGPALDGGYYLIGLRGPWKAAYSRLFHGIAWSTDQVLAQTVSAIEASGLSCGLLAIREDVDTLDSLLRLLSMPIDPRLKASLQSLLTC
jgi:uncharacterized protein